MSEIIKSPEVLNKDSQEFINKLVNDLTIKYKTMWLMHQHAIEKNGQVFYSSRFGFAYSFDERQVEISKNISEDLEFRGFTLKKFPLAVETMLKEQKEIPLPDFLADELSDIENTLSTMGTILNSQGKRVNFVNRRNDELKTGGIIKVFDGYQIAVKIKYGMKSEKNIVPTTKPSEVKLMPARLLKNAYWYDSIFLR